MGMSAVDLEELFVSCYYDTPLGGGGGGDGGSVSGGAYNGMAPEPEPTTSAPPPATAGESAHDKKRSAGDAGLGGGGDDDDDDVDENNLTDKQKLERRERNREHAKRSRLRKKFLLESLQEQIHGMQEQMDKLKDALRAEVPDKAQSLIEQICGDKEKFTPLPMPSGFGPVKTLMEPDFRLMSALSGSQQNFAISDPTLPDNPIVYVSQGFLDLTGYKLDQVLGRNCRFLQGPGTDQNAVDVIRKGIADGIDTSVCLLNYKADGTPFWNQFFVASLRDAANNVVNYVGVQCEVSKAVVEQHMGTSGSGGADKKKKAT
jgi:PAS domain S-box-containing protein